MPKVCFKCNIEKELGSFYKHKGMLDGHLNKCIDCTKKDVDNHRKINIEKIRDYDRNRGNRQTSDYQKSYRKNNPKKYKAVIMINTNIKNGSLLKPDNCENCQKKTRVVGHHDDYDKPLEVRWLCQACHKQWHAKHGEGKNG